MELFKIIAIVCMAMSFGIALGYLVTEAHWRQRFGKFRKRFKVTEKALALAKIQHQIDTSTINEWRAELACYREVMPISEVRRALEFNIGNGGV